MFFVVTTGRSGSKSIAKYLSYSSDVICLHEPEPALIKESTQYLYGKYSHKEIVELLRATRYPPVGITEYGESNQKFSFIIPTLADAFPDCKFIWLVRDGREVVNSVFLLGWYDANVMSDSEWQKYLIEAPQVGDMEEEQWEKLTNFAKCCWYWSFTNKLISEQLTSINRSRWLLVRIHDIKEQEICKLLEINAIGKPFPWVNKKKKYLKENEHWQNWDERQRNTFELICGKKMDELCPGWITNNGKWIELTTLSQASKLKHRLQEKLVNVSGKQSLIYKAVYWPIRILFRGYSTIIIDKLDKIYRRISGEE